MKKYNKSEIMKNAWNLVRTLGMTMSEALRKAWADAKTTLEKVVFEGFAKVIIHKNGKTNPYIGTEYDSESNYLTFKLWEKGNNRRIYINDYKRRSCGYIDLNNNNVIVDAAGYCSAYETAQWFLSNYAIA